MKLRYVVASPSGNITIYVLTPCSRAQYAFVAQYLLALPDLKGEQVGFVKSIGVKNILEMSGLEFCGNAGRAFALYSAKKQGLSGKQKLLVTESGTDQELEAEVEVDTGYAKINMPKPINIVNGTTLGLSQGVVVDLGGITHVVLRNVAPSEEGFAKIKKVLYAQSNPAAMGVMFYEEELQRLTPVVYVESIKSLYWEGSCGSGSLATAIALCNLETDGRFTYSFHQPAGSLEVTVEKSQGVIVQNSIAGKVTFGVEREIDIEL